MSSSHLSFFHGLSQTHLLLTHSPFSEQSRLAEHDAAAVEHIKTNSERILIISLTSWSKNSACETLLRNDGGVI